MKEGIVDVFNTWFDNKMTKIHTVIPGEIVSYDGHDKRTAQVKPLITLKTNKGLSIELPPIDNVPVQFPSSSTFNFLYPLKKGDGCLIAFSEVGIGNFMNNSGVVEADDISRFSLTDAICIPGLFSPSVVPTDTKATIEILDDGTIKQDGKAIELNGNSKSFVTFAELDSALQTVMSTIQSHIHVTTATVGATAVPGIIAPTVSPITLNIASAETTTIKTGG